MTKKVKDLAVAAGKYIKDGKEKNRYLNVGVVLETNDGGKFILLDRTFSPAGCPNPEGKSTVLISMFDPKDGGHASEQQPAPASNPVDTDEIPF